MDEPISYLERAFRGLAHDLELRRSQMSQEAYAMRLADIYDLTYLAAAQFKATDADFDAKQFITNCGAIYDDAGFEEILARTLVFG